MDLTGFACGDSCGTGGLWLAAFSAHQLFVNFANLISISCLTPSTTLLDARWLSAMKTPGLGKNAG
jgi:hypothetical protein